MKYKAPFYATAKALYAALNHVTGVEIFDAAVPIDEIEDYFKNQSEFIYGIMGAANSDMVDNKDLVIWESSLEIELYSNYKGRKKISQTLEQILNFLSSQKGWDSLQEALKKEGFFLVSVTVGAMRINLPIYSDRGIWQSGSTTISLKIVQKSEG